VTDDFGRPLPLVPESERFYPHHSHAAEVERDVLGMPIGPPRHDSP
jgi:hypothetical protein